MWGQTPGQPRHRGQGWVQQTLYLLCGHSDWCPPLDRSTNRSQSSTVTVTGTPPMNAYTRPMLLWWWWWGYLYLPNLHSVTSFGVLKLAVCLPQTWANGRGKRPLQRVNQSWSQAVCAGHKKTPNRNNPRGGGIAPAHSSRHSASRQQEREAAVTLRAEALWKQRDMRSQSLSPLYSA